MKVVKTIKWFLIPAGIVLAILGVAIFIPKSSPLGKGEVFNPIAEPIAEPTEPISQTPTDKYYYDGVLTQEDVTVLVSTYNATKGIPTDKCKDGCVGDDVVWASLLEFRDQLTPAQLDTKVKDIFQKTDMLGATEEKTIGSLLNNIKEK